MPPSVLLCPSRGCVKPLRVRARGPAWGLAMAACSLCLRGELWPLPLPPAAWTLPTGPPSAGWLGVTGLECTSEDLSSKLAALDPKCPCTPETRDRPLCSQPCDGRTTTIPDTRGQSPDTPGWDHRMRPLQQPGPSSLRRVTPHPPRLPPPIGEPGGWALTAACRARGGDQWCAPPASPPSAVAVRGRHVLGAPDGSAAGTDTWPWAALPLWVGRAGARPGRAVPVGSRPRCSRCHRRRPAGTGPRTPSGPGGAAVLGAVAWGGGEATVPPPGVAHFPGGPHTVPSPSPGPSIQSQGRECPLSRLQAGVSREAFPGAAAVILNGVEGAPRRSFES